MMPTASKRPKATAQARIAPGGRGEKRAPGEERENATQLLLEEKAHQEARDERPQNPHFVKHLADGQALLGRLGLRERLTEERDAVERGRHEEESELHLPAHVHAVPENPADEATDHEAGRPARMENVQVMRAVVGEERGDERVGHRFERAVGQGEHERPDIQEHVRGSLRLSLGCGKGDEGRQHVEQKRRHDQLAVADLVHDHAADDDAEAEAGETGSADGAELRTSEAEIGGPVGKNAAADGEADAGGENGQEAGPEQSLGVGRDAFVAHKCIAHSFLLYEADRVSARFAGPVVRFSTRRGRSSRDRLYRDRCRPLGEVGGGGERPTAPGPPTSPRWPAAS